MLINLIEAYEDLADGEFEALKDTVDALKALPRTSEGVFDFTAKDMDVWEGARIAFPVYCGYETQCNKKEGYPDLLKQFRVLDKIVDADFTAPVVAAYMDMLISTIEVMSPEIYEYYREVVDLFRAVTKKTIDTFYKDGAFAMDSVSAQMVGNAILRGCDSDILLAEKYVKYADTKEEE